MDTDNLVNLSIGKDVVNPIVEKSIKSAITHAMGGSEKVIEMVISTILNTKVDSSGKPSTYSIDRDRTWLDFVLTKNIEEACKTAIQEEIKKSSSIIKDALVRKLQTKAGSDKVASALLSALDGTFGSWRSEVKIDLKPIERV